METRAKKTEYWILNTFQYNRVLLRNILIYTAKHSFRYRKNIEMRPHKKQSPFLNEVSNRKRFCWKSLLITCKNLVDTENLRIFAPAIEGTAYRAENRSSMKTGAGLKWWQAPVIYEDPESGLNRGFSGQLWFQRTFNRFTEIDK